MPAGTAEVVLTTKLFTPKSRRDLVGQDRLFALLRRGMDAPLTLVAAPPGWGKSTLVGGWLRRDAIPAGWVSLDSGDDDPKRFWRYVVLATRPGHGYRDGHAPAPRCRGF